MDATAADPKQDASVELAQLRSENARMRGELEELRRSGSPKTVIGMADALLMVNAYGQITYANGAAEKLFEVARAQLVGRALKDVAGPRLTGEDLISVVMATKVAGREHTVELSRTGGGVGDQPRHFEVTGALTGVGVQLLISDKTDYKRMYSTLARFLSPQVLETVLQSGVDPYQARKYELTVLFADLRGFTALSSRLPAEDVKKLIDEYLTVQIDIILQEGATLDKIVGDEVMALFGAPLARSDHAAWSVNTALKMREGHRRLMGVWERRNLSACQLGIGINSGEMVVGPIGSKQQMNYTVLGHNVNLAARLCSAAAGGEILLSPRTFELARDHFSEKPGAIWRPMKFVRGKVLNAKGISEPVQTVGVQLAEEAT